MQENQIKGRRDKGEERNMVIKNGNVFCNDGIFRKTDIEVTCNTISAIGEKLPGTGQEIVDAADHYVVPGLVDVHMHGAMGADFSDGTVDAIRDIAKYQLENGVTSFLGTTMTLPEKQLHDICAVSREFINADLPDQAVIRGIHLEGPFIGFERRGAQNAAYIVPPDILMFKRFNEASGDSVKIIVAAPEVEGCIDFIRAASKECAVSLAHSSAGYDMASKGFAAGANHVTHLFNGMDPFNHREPGIAGAAFDSGAYVELISDGVHIHPSVVRAVFKLFGSDRVCLISDSMRACGLEDGQYDLGGQSVTVAGRTATIENGSLAGSVTPLTDCLRRAVEFGVPLADALKAATVTPAKSAGIDHDIGSISIGKRADILIMNKELQLKHVIFNGTRFS